MRITNIEIKNFKAFHGKYEIDLTSKGKNLALYGENGSGKSSLFQALKLFLEAGVNGYQFADHKNVFIEVPPDTEFDGYVFIYLAEDETAPPQKHEWSPDASPAAPFLASASKRKGFIDYKALLETHYVHRGPEVNLFDLLVKTVLANAVNSFTPGQTFGEQWDTIQELAKGRITNPKEVQLNSILDQFNNGLRNILENELGSKANEILRKFGYPLEIKLVFEQGVIFDRSEKVKENRLKNQAVILRVERFVNQPIPEHHFFLNEAKLSAIAISVYFASLLVQPSPPGTPKILALDDILIGLDMSNRLPVLDILAEYFADYQVFMFTYDKHWFEVIKQHTELTKKWAYRELYAKRLSPDDFEIPFMPDDSNYIKKAEQHLADCDYKAAAIYIRTGFEKLIKTFCEHRPIKVTYKSDSKSYTTDDFWGAIVSWNDKIPDGQEKIAQDTITAIKMWRGVIMNPLSHYDIGKPEFKGEIEQAIKAVKKLNTTFENLKKSEKTKLKEELAKKTAEITKLQKKIENSTP